MFPGQKPVLEGNKKSKSRRDQICHIIVRTWGGLQGVKGCCKVQDGHSKVSGRELMNRMHAAHVAYDVEFLFCDKGHTGMKIAEILGVR